MRNGQNYSKILVTGGAGFVARAAAKSLKRLVNKEDLENLYAAPRPGDIHHSCTGIDKAKRVLGYTPGFFLEKGLGELVAWFKHGHSDGFADS